MDHGTQMLQPFGHGALRQIRTADRVAQIKHDFGNAAHAGSADAHEVNVLDNKLHKFSP